MKLNCIMSVQCPWLQPVLTQLLRSYNYSNFYYFRNTFRRAAAKKLPPPPTPVSLPSHRSSCKIWSQKPFERKNYAIADSTSTSMDAFNLEYTDQRFRQNWTEMTGHKVQHFVVPKKVEQTPTYMMSRWINSKISGWIIKTSWQQLLLPLEKQVFPASPGFFFLLSFFFFFLKLPSSEYSPDVRHITYIVFNLHNIPWSIIIIPTQKRKLRL